MEGLVVLVLLLCFLLLCMLFVCYSAHNILFFCYTPVVVSGKKFPLIRSSLITHGPFAVLLLLLFHTPDRTTHLLVQHASGSSNQCGAQQHAQGPPTPLTQPPSSPPPPLSSCRMQSDAARSAFTLSVVHQRQDQRRITAVALLKAGQRVFLGLDNGVVEEHRCSSSSSSTHAGTGQAANAQ